MQPYTDLFTHPVDMVGHVHKDDISMETWSVKRRYRRDVDGTMDRNGMRHAQLTCGSRAPLPSPHCLGL